MVENLLDFSNFDFSSAPIERSFYKADEALNDMVLKIKSFHENAQIILETDEKLVEITIGFNFSKIMRALKNLIDNAVSNSFRDHPIKICATLDDRNILRIDVKSMGNPIPHEEVEKIFMPFTMSSLTDKGQDGVGLGLTICRMIAQAHFGTLTLTQNDVENIVFTLEIPQ